MKSRKKTWETLKDNNCPKCKQPLEKGMFDNNYTSCMTENCGFGITDNTKELLVNRDHKTQELHNIN